MIKIIRNIVQISVLTLIVISACKKNNGNTTPVRKATVSTVGGIDNYGYVDGPLATARLYNPTDVAIASDGTIYVSDYYSYRIRKIANGQITTVAGNSQAAVKNGKGTNASFAYPTGIVFDPFGNLLVSEGENYSTVRTMTPDGAVSTYAGKDTTGHTDGDTSIASFYHSSGRYAVNASGDVFVADYYNNVVRKITKAGQVSTIAGSGVNGHKDGKGTDAQLSDPYAIAADRQGNIYVSENTYPYIRKITPDGNVTTLAGSGIVGYLDGKAADAQFYSINSMVCDQKNNLFIADLNAIRMVSPNGTVSTIAGGPVNGFIEGSTDSARFNYPLGLTIDKQGNIYVADTYNDRIRKITFQ